MANASASTSISPQALDVWYRLLRTHASITRELDAVLRANTSLTINDYDVLVHLRDADQGALRMGCLAERVVLSRSGMTRLIDGLVKDGLVERKQCAEDARGSWAVLTTKGRAIIEGARDTHHEVVFRMFADHVTDGELATLGAVFERLIEVAAPQSAEAITRECDH